MKSDVEMDYTRDEISKTLTELRILRSAVESDWYSYRKRALDISIDILLNYLDNNFNV